MSQQAIFRSVLDQLRQLGYGDGLLREGWRFKDWFSTPSEAMSEFTADAAAFGRLPFGHDNACFAVVITRNSTGPDPISRYRSLGAPLAFEITPNQVLLWIVRAENANRTRPTAIAPDELNATFASHVDDWSPAAMLRAKNIVPGPRIRQPDFIDLGLMPALEEHMREKLDPLLREIFFAAMKTYQIHKSTQPNPGKLFRLVFRVLAGKVMTDRQMPSFQRFATSPNPNELLAAVNSHFGDQPHLIADAATRQVVVDRFWSAFSLDDISASVLSLIWENTLVDDEVRQAVGLYGTPTSVARYMADRIKIDQVTDEEERP